MQVCSQDTPWTYSSKFFGGVSGAHAINRVFDEDSGVVRMFFWFALFCVGAYAAVYYSGSIVGEFLSKGVVTLLGTAGHDGEMPQVTICQSSAVRCSCEAFYESDVLTNHFDKIVPYLCIDMLVFKDKDLDAADPLARSPDLAGVDEKTGERVSYTTYENANRMVDRTETIAHIEGMRTSGALAAKTTVCGTENRYTKSWFTKQIKSSDLSYMDLIMYAGYTRRTQILKECMTVDSEDGSPTKGQKISCMGDEWWSDMWVDENYGACHTFNPCTGIPVGAACEEDAECDHDLNQNAISGKNSNLPEHAQVAGGFCDQDATPRKCSCKACKAGKGCKQAVQTKSGKGHGLRLMLNAAVDEDAIIGSASRSAWSPGVMVHMHSEFDKGLTSEAFVAPPGEVIDVAIQKNNYEEMEYPYTNCSSTYNIDTSLCQANCLRRVQVMKCCTAEGEADMKPVIKGKFSEQINYTDPANQIEKIENPILACNILKTGYRKCMAEQQQKFQDGEICLDGASSFGEPFSFFFFRNSKLNSYDEAGSSETGISAMEERSLGMKKHCVWSEDENGGLEAYKGGRLGKECVKDKDCRSSLGDEGLPGRCLDAHRAYCPPRCKRIDFKPAAISTSPLSKTTTKLVANRELAFRTKQQTIKMDNPEKKWWKPLCNATGADPANMDVDDSTTWPNTPIKYTVKEGVKQGGDWSTCNAADVKASEALADDDHCVSPLCMTQSEAEARVKENYAVVNMHYLDFEAVTNKKDEAMPLADLLGILGGNLGLFCGFSILTIIEWIEAFVFFLLGIPWLFFKFFPGRVFVRNDDPTESDDLPYDEDVLRVMKNVQKIAAKRHAAAGDEHTKVSHVRSIFIFCVLMSCPLACAAHSH